MMPPEKWESASPWMAAKNGTWNYTTFLALYKLKNLAILRSWPFWDGEFTWPELKGYISDLQGLGMKFGHELNHLEMMDLKVLGL